MSGKQCETNILKVHYTKKDDQTKHTHAFIHTIKRKCCWQQLYFHLLSFPPWNSDFVVFTRNRCIFRHWEIDGDNWIHRTKRTASRCRVKNLFPSFFIEVNRVVKKYQIHYVFVKKNIKMFLSEVSLVRCSVTQSSIAMFGIVLHWFGSPFYCVHRLFRSIVADI